jgi:hypothetical protein
MRENVPFGLLNMANFSKDDVLQFHPLIGILKVRKKNHT